MIVFRESQEELQRALELGKISPNNIFDGSQSLLQLAFGWPQGVKILLHSGVDANKLTTMLLSSPTRYIDDMDVDFDAYYESTRLVLEAGCMLTVCDIDRFTSRKLQSLLAHELAKRRWKLWELSKSHFPNNEQLDLDARRDAVPDIQAARICKAFAAQGRTIDPQLLVGELTPSVYHECSLYTETMEELFEAGFRDVNSASSSGVTPLMVTRSLGIGSKHKLIRRAAWLISKGADAHRKLPRSNATVAHLLSAEMTGILLSLTLHGSFQSGGLAQWQFWEERISPHKFNVFPVPSVRDDCFCACCPSGCTVLSVALRQICRWAWWPYVSNRSFVFQRLLHMLIDYTQSSPSVSQTLIRCLTFDAIGLRHTCCIEIEDEETAEDMEGREERELLEILEEDERELEDLKGLISEFERKFDDLGLPIWEFLETYWHKRVVEYLLKQDPYDEEHNRAVNAIGIDLQVEEEVPLDRVSLLIGDPYDEKQERKAKVIDSKAGKELIPDPISLLLHARNLKKR
jgi:hypothetical protein